MKIDSLRTAAFALALALSGSPSLAQDKPKATAEPGAKSAKMPSKPAAPVKPVDLNSAGKAELKRLPGIGDAEADRIIAARPFRTKAELVTRNLIADHQYPELRRLVEVRNPPMPKLKGAGS
ncbi:MAG: hypothetical protein A3I63_06560 [Betaproteobacteria bacterium RIFCSPLOWO2_02_FULL_66_14]|nr:MAG: hypothetical protein A3I63_06560 [Betaproteobacteria bacterium RIFCSPLOWO2_02_FULL_66_14]